MDMTTDKVGMICAAIGVLIGLGCDHADACDGCSDDSACRIIKYIAAAVDFGDMACGCRGKASCNGLIFD